jgi:cyclic pyranopterin phosphate synthase
MELKSTGQPTQTHPATPQRPVYDHYHRPLQDLRISVIDRCNFRCTYCMPDSNRDRYSFLPEDNWLTFDEIERLTRLFVQLGVTKIRLTGGEPLLRPNLPDLILKLRRIPGVSDLALTTNGSLLSKYAAPLLETGLDRITISLNTLDENVYHRMSGGRGKVDTVLKGIDIAAAVGFKHIKVNVVLQRNVNDRHILELVKYFKDRQIILRFIEYMDVGNCNHWRMDEVVPSIEVVEMINRYFPIKPVKSNYFGEVAARYRFLDGSGEIGFITSITQPFCRSCTRLRLSADGKIYTCLFSGKGTDLKKHLKKNPTDEQLSSLLASVWTNRSDRYSEMRSEANAPAQSSPKVEMFQIGG